MSEMTAAPTVTLQALAMATQMASQTAVATGPPLMATQAAEVTVLVEEASVVLGVTRCLT